MYYFTFACHLLMCRAMIFCKAETFLRQTFMLYEDESFLKHHDCFMLIMLSLT